MASYDGTNKSSAGCAQHLPYWEIKTEHTKNLYNEAMAMASPEAVAFCDPDNYQGPDIEVDASTLTEDQWQARRADHLGGSDISAIFGENHFKTNLDLYYSKTGKVPAVQEEESSASRLNKLWGHISEEYVDAWLSEKYPYNDIITDTNIYAMPGRPYITANIDRMMRKPDGSYCLVEIKTTSPFNKAAWENGNIPIPYIYQVRTYMAILGVWECVVVCMFDRDTLIANTIKRDLDEEMRIIQGCPALPAACVRSSNVLSADRKSSEYKDISAASTPTRVTFGKSCPFTIICVPTRISASSFANADKICSWESFFFVVSMSMRSTLACGNLAFTISSIC